MAHTRPPRCTARRIIPARQVRRHSANDRRGGRTKDRRGPDRALRPYAPALRPPNEKGPARPFRPARPPTTRTQLRVGLSI